MGLKVVGEETQPLVFILNTYPFKIPVKIVCMYENNQL